MRKRTFLIPRCRHKYKGGDLERWHLYVGTPKQVNKAHRGKNAKNITVDGFCYQFKQSIYIAETKEEDNNFSTVIHETIHASLPFLGEEEVKNTTVSILSAICAAMNLRLKMAVPTKIIIKRH